MSIRDAGKEERRQVILSTAERLIREHEGIGFSMRELAREAGVSFATPFNLFESKSGVLIALVYSKVPGKQEKFVKAARRLDPIDRLFRLARKSAEIYTSDPELFRPLVAAMSAISDSESREIWETVARVWFSDLDSAREDGMIDSKRDLNLLAWSLHVLFRGALLQWASREIDDKELRLQVQLGVAIWLMSAVTKSARSRVVEKRNKFERELRKYRL
jgi:AcrR family transcriptional regulator